MTKRRLRDSPFVRAVVEADEEAARRNAPAPAARTIWLVIQEGGTSGEHYASFYNTAPQANAAIRSHQKASYNCFGPFPVKGVGGPKGGLLVTELDLLDLVSAVRSADYAD